MTPSSLVKSSLSSDFEGTGSTSRKEDLIATLTTRVVEVMPNGNLRIQGNKAVAVNNETQYITLSGIVRQTDISSRNVVDSKYILDSRISYTGKGVISAKQRPGWLTQLLDYVTPF
jgi:flagellar L-ring protein precursor FlgH